MTRLPVRRTAAVLLAGVATTAHADPIPLAAQRPIKPAVQLLRVREAAAPTETARGAPAPTVQPFDPFFDPTAVPRSAPGVGGVVRTSDTTASQPPGMYPPATGYPIDPRTQLQQPAGAPRSVWGSMTDWTAERARALKTVLAGPPPQQPDPRVGQFGQPMPTTPMPMGQYGQPMAMSNQPFRGVTPGGQAAYAGNPAYRWYGWGTTTPGANPYAPTGEYPAASSQWHAMSGTTPGAFPAPVMNPYRDAPGAGAPAYATRTPPRPIGAVPPPAVAFEPPAVPGPAPIVESAPFRYVPPDELPVGAVVVPGVPAPPPEWRGQPLSAKPPAEPAAEVVWQPVSYTAPAASSPPRVIAWQTDAKPLTLKERAAAVCGSGVSNLEVKQLGADAVIVRFDAASDAVAERAAKAIAEIAELKRFTVTFDVVVSGK